MSDIREMTLPLGEISLGDAISFIDRLRAEVYRARSERAANERRIKITSPDAIVLMGDCFIHSTSGRKYVVTGIIKERPLIPNVPTKTTFNVTEVCDPGDIL